MKIADYLLQDRNWPGAIWIEFAGAPGVFPAIRSVNPYGATVMNRTLTMITTALFATALTGAAIAGGDKHKVTFNELDTDGDGVVSMSELNTAEDSAVADRLTEEWSNLDANQDGSLDQSEFAKFEPIMNADEHSEIQAEEDDY